MICFMVKKTKSSQKSKNKIFVQLAVLFYLFYFLKIFFLYLLKRLVEIIIYKNIIIMFFLKMYALYLYFILIVLLLFHKQTNKKV